MKQTTRDNLIYLAVAFGIVALIVADFIHADSHGQKMWWPSRFSSRAVYTTILLVYFIVRESRKLKSTLVQVLEGITIACIVHLAIVFAFHQVVDQLPGLVFSALTVFEIFFVFELAMAAIKYLKPERKVGSRGSTGLN